MSLQDDYGGWLKNLWKTQSSGEFKILQDGTLIALRRGPLVSFQYFSWANQLVKSQKGFYLIYWQRLLLSLLNHWHEAKPCHRLSQIYQWVKTNPQAIDWSYRYSLFKPNAFYSNLRGAIEECSRLTCKVNPTKELIRDVKTRVKCEAKGGCWVASTTKKKGQRCLKGGRLRFVSDKLEKRVLKELKSQIPKSLMGWLKIMIDDALMKNVLIGGGGSVKSVGSGPLTKVLRLPSKSPRLKLSPAQGDSYIQSRINLLQSYTRRMMTIIQKAGFCSAYASSKKDDTVCKRRAKKYETVIHQVEDMSKELIRCHAIHGSNQEQVLGCIRETNRSIKELGRQIEEIEDQVFKMDTKLKRSVKAKSPDKEEGEPRPSDWSIKWMVREILGLVAASVSAMFSPWRWLWNKTKDYLYRAKEWAKGNQLQAILVVLVLAALSLGVITTSWGGVLLSLVEPSFWLLFDVYMWWCSRTWLDKFFYTLGAMAIDLILKGLTPENSRLLKAIRKIKDMVLFILHLMTPFCLVTNLFGDKLKKAADKVRNRKSASGDCKPCGKVQTGECEKIRLAAEEKVKEAEARAEGLKKQLKEMEEEAEKLGDNVGDAEKEMDKLKKELKKAQEAATSAKAEADQLVDNLRDAEKEISKVEGDAGEAAKASEKKIAEVKAQADSDVKARQEEIANLEAKVKESQTNIAQLKNQEEVDSQLAETKISELESKAEEYQTKIAKLEAEAKAAEQKAAQELEVAKAEAKAADRKSQTKIAELEAETKAAKQNAAKELEVAKAEARADIEKAEQEIGRLVEEASKDSETAKAKITELEEEAKSLKDKIQDLESSSEIASGESTREILGMKADVKRLENTIGVMRVEAATNAKTSSKTIAALEREKEVANKRISELERSLSNEQAATQEAQAEIASLQDQSSTSLVETTARQAEDSREIQALKDKIKSLEKRIEMDEYSDEMAMEAEKAVRQTLINQHEERMAKLKKEHGRALSNAAKNMGIYADRARKEEQASFAGFKQDADEKLKNLEASLQKSMDEVQETKVKLAEALAKGIVDGDKATELLEEANRSHLEHINKIIDDYEGQLADQNLRFEEDLKKMGDFYQDRDATLVDGIAKQTNRFTMQVETFQAQQAKTDAQLQVYRQQTGKLRDTVSELQEEVERLTEAYNEALAMAREARVMGSEEVTILQQNATSLAKQLEEAQHSLSDQTVVLSKVPTPRIVLTKKGFTMAENGNPLFDWKKKALPERICELSEGPPARLERDGLVQPDVLATQRLLSQKPHFGPEEYKNISRVVSEMDSPIKPIGQSLTDRLLQSSTQRVVEPTDKGDEVGGMDGKDEKEEPVDLGMLGSAIRWFSKKIGVDPKDLNWNPLEEATRRADADNTDLFQDALELAVRTVGGDASEVAQTLAKSTGAPPSAATNLLNGTNVNQNLVLTALNGKVPGDIVTGDIPLTAPTHDIPVAPFVPAIPVEAMPVSQPAVVEKPLFNPVTSVNTGESSKLPFHEPKPVT